jgi:hypothetical protein
MASPEDRRAVGAEMKATLVEARVGLDTMRASLADLRGRLEREQRELDTVRRRRALADGIGDAETVRVARHFEHQHEERVTVLGRRVEVQEAELALAEREVAEMTDELRAVLGGAAPGRSPAPGAARSADDHAPGRGSDSHDPHAAEIDAELRLAALKRRMGQ